VDHDIYHSSVYESPPYVSEREVIRSLISYLRRGSAVQYVVMLLPFHWRLTLCIALVVCPASVARSQGDNLRDWIGKTPVIVKSKPRQSIYNSPTLRPRLIKLLGRKRYLHLANFYYTMSPIKDVDGYLIAFMCEHHFCPHNSSFMAVNLDKGDIHVAFFSDGYVQWFHTKGKAKDLPIDVLYYPWWMQSPGTVTKVVEKTRRAT
jgi:hypothetical protein